MRVLRNLISVPIDSMQPDSLKLLESILLAVLVLSALSLRLNYMNDSLWLDEAWVANSVIAPSVSEMLYYDEWVQTTPPLLLIFMRTAVVCFGENEMALRLVPWIAGLVSVLTIVLTLRKRFRFSLVLIGTTLFATNYYALKYAQHVKQYSTDLLVSCLFLIVVWKILESGINRRLYWTIAGLGTVGAFLSYTAVFWFPTAIIVVFLKPSHAEKKDYAWSRNILRIDTLFFLILCSSSFVALYFLFVLPNHDPNLIIQWRGSYLGSVGFLQSLILFLQNIFSLLVPRAAGLALVSYTFIILFLTGILRAIIGATRSEDQAFYLLLVIFVPIVTSVIVSFFRQYPLLNKERFLIWMLPALVVLIIYAVEPLWIRIEELLQAALPLRIIEIIVAVLCILYVMTNMWFLKRHPQIKEEVREAVEYLRDEMGPRDALFVHGANEQQFVFYTRFFNWSPSSLYMGATEWPCCHRNRSLRVSNPQVKSFEEDVHSFLLRARGHKIWLLLPAANDPRHWTRVLKGRIRGVPALMFRKACRLIKKENFSNVLVYAYICNEEDH